MQNKLKRINNCHNKTFCVKKLHKMFFCAIIDIQEGLVMIIEVRIDNYRVFNNPVALSAKADLRNKRFAFNVFKNEKFNILKSL